MTLPTQQFTFEMCKHQTISQSKIISGNRKSDELYQDVQSA